MMFVDLARELKKNKKKKTVEHESDSNINYDW